MLSRMKRVLLAVSAALLLTGAGASGAAFAQDRAPAPMVTSAVWNGQGAAALDTKVDWRHDRWRSDRHNNWRRDNWHDRRGWNGRGGWDRHDWRRERWREHRGWRHHRNWGWW